VQGGKELSPRGKIFPIRLPRITKIRKFFRYLVNLDLPPLQIKTPKLPKEMIDMLDDADSEIADWRKARIFGKWIRQWEVVSWSCGPVMGCGKWDRWTIWLVSIGVMFYGGSQTQRHVMMKIKKKNNGKCVIL
jgi:hypothetical protein